ncbi:hypothetical protein Pryu01_03079 [Paraliobacillus ryukyuensis]|uniref:Uncharacterized protein n=1 Tax=Paraliobacillus ryukyuensis TaxID=200904 RepID=A0A366DRC2_9BACI|nr:hypothetical protein DES48_1189 [Paraliobacillus ryukyuensis]
MNKYNSVHSFYNIAETIADKSKRIWKGRGESFETYT